MGVLDDELGEASPRGEPPTERDEIRRGGGGPPLARGDERLRVPPTARGDERRGASGDLGDLRGEIICEGEAGWCIGGGCSDDGEGGSCAV
jgi:hypothetical protein